MHAENLRLIGKLAKLHGFEGEALLITDSVFAKNIEKTEWVFIIIDGLPVPFFVLNLRLRSDSAAVLKLEDVNSTDKMSQYVGNEVFIEETRKARKSNKTTESIKGYLVIDTEKGSIGIASEVINYNNNYVLQIFKGETEILIPVHDSVILEINDQTKTIMVTTPEGLLDLYI